ncbi:peptidoglycan bridge formation glycyltransferase FemA/FemB family protein [Candidatus Woesebacteria bacterium]|nr:peptidoglycan bridge formation glycyltransferase FemA/FemB family protein [Candidatus Woesebacteria bacterium]
MTEIGWKTEIHGDSQLYYRSLGPLTIAKIQRPKSLDLSWLQSFRKKHKTLTTYIEPGLTTTLPEKRLGFTVEPFAHSCTSLIDLRPTEPNILNSFSQKTRYNIVHSLKKSDLKIETTQLDMLSDKQLADFFSLHTEWSKQKHVIGYSKELLNGILKSFAKSGDLHLCYKGSTLVGTLLTLYHDSVATYWAAFANPIGYKSFAPTLLTWVAIQTAKSKKCEIFDFGGIYDPRYPKMYKKWQGFTKFKSGFNPTVISYPPTTLQLLW